MPLSMQAKLLRFLENRRYMRLGGTVKLQADVRMIFATLRPLEAEVQAGRFRPDLYYRIQGVTVHVPPLRERKADIVPLLGQFVRQISAHHGTPPPRVGRAARAALMAYAWPGNVRELRNVVELLCLLRAGRSIRPSDLPRAVTAAPGGDGGATIALSLDRPLAALVEQIMLAVLEREGIAACTADGLEAYAAAARERRGRLRGGDAGAGARLVALDQASRLGLGDADRAFDFLLPWP